MDSLEDQILAILPSAQAVDISIDQLQRQLNDRLARQSNLRHVKLGWLSGQSRRRIEAALKGLQESGKVVKETRRTVMHSGNQSRLFTDYYRKILSS